MWVSVRTAVECSGHGDHDLPRVLLHSEHGDTVPLKHRGRQLRYLNTGRGTEAPELVQEARVLLEESRVGVRLSACLNLSLKRLWTSLLSTYQLVPDVRAIPKAYQLVQEVRMLLEEVGQVLAHGGLQHVCGCSGNRVPDLGGSPVVLVQRVQVQVLHMLGSTGTNKRQGPRKTRLT